MDATVAEVAEALGISEDAVRKRIAAGTLKAERVGQRLLLVPREELERAQAEGRLKRGRKPRARP